MARSRVLVVDDEQDMLDVCQDVLRKLPDVDLQVEAQGPRALERLTHESFDLLLTDVRMPRIGGLELRQRNQACQLARLSLPRGRG